MFGVDMSYSIHFDNKKKDTSILDEGSTHGLDVAALTTQKKYSINFTVTRNKFCFKFALQWSK